tara:strand:- start:47 stop:226 length:180 start_codon:yes stop_codon:yes gene_type:complete
MTQLTDTDLTRLKIRKEARAKGKEKFHAFYVCLPISKQRQWETYEDAKFYCFETVHYND